MNRLNFVFSIFAPWIACQSIEATTFSDIGEHLDEPIRHYQIEENEQAETGLYGVEAIASWRSEYVYRGFDLAGSTTEFQLLAQWGLSDKDSLDVGVYFGSETGSGDFSEFTAFAAYTRAVGKYSYSAELAFHEYGGSFFESGVDLNLGVSYHVNDLFDVKASLSYDTGAEGFYFESKVSYYEEVNEDSYVTLDAGISLVDDYYDRTGLNHAFAKLSYTYNINDSVSLSPYLTTILGIHDEADNHVIGGAYFAVSF